MSLADNIEVAKTCTTQAVSAWVEVLRTVHTDVKRNMRMGHGALYAMRAAYRVEFEDDFVGAYNDLRMALTIAPEILPETWR